MKNSLSGKSCLVFTELWKCSPFNFLCSALKCSFCTWSINTNYIVPLRTISTEYQSGRVREFEFRIRCSVIYENSYIFCSAALSISSWNKLILFRSHCKDAFIIFELFVLRVCCNFWITIYIQNFVILPLYNTSAVIPRKNHVFCISVCDLCGQHVYNVHHDACMCCV